MRRELVWALIAVAAFNSPIDEAVARDPAAPLRIEIGLQAVFTPPKGWDDNDRIQAVVYGELPSGCYAVAETIAQRTSEDTFVIRQFASQEREGPCDFAPILFAKVAELGTLPVGEYRLLYKDAGSGASLSSFNVAEATATGVDSLPYANVLQQFSEDILDEGAPLRVKIKGVVNSSCMELDPNVRVQREGDVFIAFPLLRKRQGPGMCMQVLIPFEHEIDLGALTAGNYLVHIRSQNGHAINHVVKVLKPAR
jgi:hypothetical protein